MGDVSTSIVPIIRCDKLAISNFKNMNTDFYISLIYQQLQGTIGSEAAKKLREWEVASQENRQVAAEIRQAWKASAQHDLPFGLDLDSDFAKVQSRLNLPAEKMAKVVPMKSRRRWLRIAAAIAFLLVAGFILQNMLTNDVAWKEVTASAEVQELSLPDGSKIWLNAGSTLSYPEQFSDNERPVKLNGEAFFEVAKDANRPFQVLTNRAMVTVLGTAFNVRDLADETASAVSVKEGKVRVEATKTQQEVVLIANEKAVFDEVNNTLIKEEDKNLNGLAWQRKKLKFQETTFMDVAGTIAQQYQVSVTIRNQEMLQCLVNGQYNLATEVASLLKNIAAIYGAEVTEVGERNFEITGGSCQ